MVDALKPLTGRAKAPLSRNACWRHAGTNRCNCRRWGSCTASCWRWRQAPCRGREIATSWDDCLRYGRSVRDWPAFPDTAAALTYLKQHYKLVILSNVDNENFGFSNRKLGVDFDAIYTAEDIGSYKPSLNNFEYMLARLSERGIARSAILHTADTHVP